MAVALLFSDIGRSLLCLKPYNADGASGFLHPADSQLVIGARSRTISVKEVVAALALSPRGGRMQPSKMAGL